MNEWIWKHHRYTLEGLISLIKYLLWWRGCFLLWEGHQVSLGKRPKEVITKSLFSLTIFPNLWPPYSLWGRQVLLLSNLCAIVANISVLLFLFNAIFLGEIISKIIYSLAFRTGVDHKSLVSLWFVIKEVNERRSVFLRVWQTMTTSPIQPLPVFESKALLKHSHICSFRYCLWLLSLPWQSWVVATEARGPAEPQIFTI